MSTSVENGVHVSRQYWPGCGTIVAAMPADLNDLWTDSPDQAAVFVAEALIANPPNIYLGSDGRIVAYLWDVGGDVLAVYAALDELIVNMNCYNGIRSQAQADDVVERIARLTRIETAIAKATADMRGQIGAWEERGKGGS